MTLVGRAASKKYEHKVPKPIAHFSNYSLVVSGNAFTPTSPTSPFILRLRSERFMGKRFTWSKPVSPS